MVVVDELVELSARSLTLRAWTVDEAADLEGVENQAKFEKVLCGACWVEAQLVDALQAPDVRKLLAVAGSSYAAAKPDELEWMKTALGTASEHVACRPLRRRQRGSVRACSQCRLLEL